MRAGEPRVTLNAQTSAQITIRFGGLGGTVVLHLPGRRAARTVAPAPRTPLDDVAAVPVGGRDAHSAIDLERLFTELIEVAVWTATGGAWQEHASFLLGTRDGQWHQVAFADPMATELVGRLHGLPDFDPDLLLDLLAPSGRRVRTLWRMSVLAAE